MDHSYIEAAQDLGANPLQVFLKAVLPLSMPGVMSGIMMVLCRLFRRSLLPNC